MNRDNKIKCIIADEDPNALSLLKHYISTVSFLQLDFIFSGIMDMLSWLENNYTDLLFIELNELSLPGLKSGAAILNSTQMVFTSSHEKYAWEGYELGAIDFLLKPFSLERFIKAINKICASTEMWNGENYYSSTTATLNGFRYFKADRKMIKVNLDDILFIESLKDYIKVVTKSGTIISRQSISSMEIFLPKHLFLRIHRSFIVSFKNIDCFTRETIEIAKYTLPVSRSYRHIMEDRLR